MPSPHLRHTEKRKKERKRKPARPSPLSYLPRTEDCSSSAPHARSPSPPPRARHCLDWSARGGEDSKRGWSLSSSASSSEAADLHYRRSGGACFTAFTRRGRASTVRRWHSGEGGSGIAADAGWETLLRRRTSAWRWGKPWRRAANPIVASGWAGGVERERICAAREWKMRRVRGKRNETVVSGPGSRPTGMRSVGEIWVPSLNWGLELEPCWSCVFYLDTHI